MPSSIMMPVTRSFDLDGINSDEICASYKDGILTLTLWMPKWELFGRETFTMEGDPAIAVITDDAIIFLSHTLL